MMLGENARYKGVYEYHISAAKETGKGRGREAQKNGEYKSWSQKDSGKE